MANLCVNIDHIATLRQARLDVEPDPVAAAVLVELAGASGITVHLREDRRHIQDHDVERLRPVVKTKLNLEMAATEEMVAIACRLQPDECTLVPEKRAELTTEGGLDAAGQKERLTAVCTRLKAAGIQVSFFIDPQAGQVDAAAEAGADTVELHTGVYAQAFARRRHADIRQALVQLQAAAERSRSRGLRLNAGHGLTFRNVLPIAGIPGMEDLNIGHNIIARAALVGLERAVKEMLELIKL
jgi:pyridoxine 5-phosphate synthase